jgi:acetylornithine/N-succinyldiaminopimelate aminotransferase
VTQLVSSPLLPTYARSDVTFVRGDGSHLWDDAGRRYLDLGTGLAVVSLGHCHPAPLAAAHAQLDKLWHASNLYSTEPQAELAALLSSRFGGAQAFFCNSGAEANEAALKYARKATGKPGVIALENSFHGRTTGSLAVTGQPAKRAAFEPLIGPVTFAIPNDVDSLRAAATGETGLILLEPVLGEGGVHVLTAEFVAAARELADELGALLCFDEVQAGMGRTGWFFAWEGLGVKPDLLTLAKALANGLPIGALLVADDAAGAFVPGDHGSTFGGNPVVCAAACAVVEAIDDALLEDVRGKGARVAAALSNLPGVLEVRASGLLIGAELDRPAAEVVDACRARGVVVLSAGERVLRLAPPLTVEQAELDHGLAVIREVLS